MSNRSWATSTNSQNVSPRRVDEVVSGIGAALLSNSGGADEPRLLSSASGHRAGERAVELGANSSTPPRLSSAESATNKSKLSQKLLSAGEIEDSYDEGVYVSRPSSWESESDGDQDASGDADDSQLLYPKALGAPSEQHDREGPEASRRAWMKKVGMGGVFFVILTLFFIVLAIIARDEHPSKYAPPICAKCDVIDTPESDIAQSLLPLV